MTTEQTATHCGVSVAALKKWREHEKGPRWYRPPGTRRVLYDADEVRAWIAQYPGTGNEAA
ncbi:helix-turn-helix transcriptional regulator [uncultured Jatrophihabitans sp.]|uniref:helix-turn-helix transcriptional regulator n=1 Tax=uncultured Jatrophihabitans sp. TaxID=1610747 RepID=UPI0035CA3DA6